MLNSMRDHDAVSFGQEFIADDGVFCDEADGGGPAGHAEGFVPDGVDVGAGFGGLDVEGVG